MTFCLLFWKKSVHYFEIRVETNFEFLKMYLPSFLWRIQTLWSCKQKWKFLLLNPSMKAMIDIIYLHVFLPFWLTKLKNSQYCCLLVSFMNFSSTYFELLILWMISKCCAFSYKFTNFDIIPFFQIFYHKIG